MAREPLSTSDYLAMSVDSLNEAETLFEHGTYRGVLNRLYYAAYYAACSALNSLKLEIPKSHSGVVALFHQHVVRSQHVPPDVAPTLGRLLETRVIGDYRRLLLNAAEVDGAFESCVAFVEAVRAEFADDIAPFVRQKSKGDES